ncbi:MAG: glycosyltransferase family 39 protein [Candidatus Colwellbacteria bacterium]|nr:glycosyltransferase family 39 protein [Candidatus Colwellbacteria bacterium]
MKKVNIPAFFIIFLAGLLMIGSIWNTSATRDELAHIPAGFGYITQQDYRLNPEHPPLIKVISAISGWIFARPHFPIFTPYWQDDVNGQWAQGASFLYESGNNADRVIFLSRLPLALLTAIFGFFLFTRIKKQFNTATAYLSLLFFAFSPTILAHTPLVTTDIGAMIGFFFGILFFIRFLENPSWKNVLFAGFIFGIVQLLKFSLILLIPLYGLLLILWSLVQTHMPIALRGKLFLRHAWKTGIIGLVGFAIIWIAYIPFVWNYPENRQLRDAEFLLSSHPARALAEFDATLIKNRITRPLGQYILGALMVTQRAGGGNNNYFLGNVSATGSPLYFPLLYLVKEPTPFHIFTLLALWYAGKKVWRRKKMMITEKYWNCTAMWIRSHFFEFSSLVFIGIYWFLSIISPLNIGVRHVLPTFPFIYVLVSKQISEWLRVQESPNPQSFFDVLRNLARVYMHAVPKFAVLVILALWLIIGTIASFPYFISFYNELGGGTRNGFEVAVDSNYDWGQDLKRLSDFVEKNDIEHIAVDYFGGGNPKYYLGDAYESWRSAKGAPHGWFAISATFRQAAFGTPVKGFVRNPEDSYEWLSEYEPVASIKANRYDLWIPDQVGNDILGL